ncbi:hypothetical protein NDU88_007767 [Pleurodeles waltl]|uniref:Uncharacterized protein n=1 Tax=Pleurodeles waltl TaxID=8319 RepID=A0AAV7RQD4_PLEWA|nr:hypothetical protein NDU88_007767 [Pleurodeles waltl]
MPPASRPRRRSNATPPLGQALSTKSSCGSTGSRWRTLLALIRSTAAAEGVGSRWHRRSGGLCASVASPGSPRLGAHCLVGHLSSWPGHAPKVWFELR